MSNKPTKRLRIFAGPNGSGKSTLADQLKNHENKKIKLGIFVNADEIEKELVKARTLSLVDYHIKSDTKTLQNFIKENGMSPLKLKDLMIHNNFRIANNKISYKGNYNSYIAADIASFIRVQLLMSEESFSFETVFSHESKLQIMRDAKELGYRVYFYFITTDDPEININRVAVRVEKNGHPVPKQKIIDRYYRTLGLLYDAIKISDRTFLFDNSGKNYKFIAEIINGKKVEIPEKISGFPNWFIDYVFKKVKN